MKKKQNQIKKFFQERDKDIKSMGKDKILHKKSIDWMLHADKYKYCYNYTWMGRPIIKYPSDIIIHQEIMWKLKPDLVIEMGIAHGGSIILSSAMMKMMDIKGEVVAVDIDIRKHNSKLIKSHPMYNRITMYEGSSIDPKIITKIKKHTKNKKCVLVILDSLHSHSHVYEELKAYAPLVTIGSYCILPDTFIEFFPKGYYSKNRPWDVGNNPYTAMKQYLNETNLFKIDKSLTNKAMITETIDGYLKRIK